MAGQGVAVAKGVGVEEVLPGDNAEGQERRQQDDIAVPRDMRSSVLRCVGRSFHLAGIFCLSSVVMALAGHVDYRHLHLITAPGPHQTQTRFGLGNVEEEDAL